MGKVYTPKLLSDPHYCKFCDWMDCEKDNNLLIYFCSMFGFGLEVEEGEPIRCDACKAAIKDLQIK